MRGASEVSSCHIVSVLISKCTDISTETLKKIHPTVGCIPINCVPAYGPAIQKIHVSNPVQLYYLYIFNRPASIFFRGGAHFFVGLLLQSLILI